MFMFKGFFSKLAPVAALAIGVTLSGCDGLSVSFDNGDGVPLSELDMSGPAPDQLALAGPDTVILTEGKTLAIDVEGDPDDKLRFDLEGERLTIYREDGVSTGGRGRATVRVTMPAPNEIDMAGSGRIEAATMATQAEINMAGSGKISVADITAETLEIAMAGSGEIEATGTAQRLEVSTMGSGTTALKDLKADTAEISIAGSGNVTFASDGEVEVNIAGSGDVTVIGSATCEMNVAGSGKVRCQNATDGDEANATSDAADAKDAKDASDEG